MKQKVFFILALLLGILVPQGAKAYDFSAVAPTGQTLYYNITNSSTHTVTVVSQNTSSPYYSSNAPSGVLEIPASVTNNGTTYSVTSIGYCAFLHCTGLTGVTIPNSVTSIGEFAFYNCTGLTSVAIPNSVTSIGQNAFDGCSGLTSVTICNSVTSIGNSAFYGCTSLTSVTIPNSVTSIGEFAFYNCTGLTSVAIPNSVTYIGGAAFQGCTGLISVNIPNSVTSINYQTFLGCTSLTSVTIPNSVTSIGRWAFSNCSGLSSVTIPSSVTSIGSSTFSKCIGLTGTVAIPNSVTSIGRNAFDSCVNLQSVVLPNNLSKLDTSVFRYCIGLTNVTIPNSVTSIGAWAFAGCSGLTSVTIPNSVTSIGDYAFQYCTSLTSVTIPNSVTSIGNGAFSGCSGLTTMNYNAVNCGGDGFTSGNNRWLFGCTALTSVNIGNSVARIPNYAFLGCTGLTHVTIPNSVTSIGEAAFVYCTNLNTINYNATNCSGDGFTIANGSFWLGGCSSLTRVNVGNNVRSIPLNAFYNRTSLHVLDLGSGLTSVGANAFYNCDHLDSIYSRSTTPPTVANTYAFENVWKGLPLTVPTGSRSAYAVAYAWRDFTNIQEFSTAPITTTYTVTVAANDATMGYVTGGGIYEQGETATLEAHAAEGFVFVQWQDSSTANPRTITVTADATYMAYFAASQGIGDAEADDVVLTAVDGRVTISGAEGRRVALVDALGRTLYRGIATEQLTIDVPATGVYLLQVDDRPAKRIAVVR